jgi:hypothetical protein
MPNYSNTITPVTSKKTIFRGDTKTYNFVLKRASIPINLTGYTIYFTACEDIDDPTGTQLFSRQCSITAGQEAEGLCQVTLSSADTDTLCTNGVAEVALVTSAGYQDTLGQFYIDIMQDAKVT